MKNSKINKIGEWLDDRLRSLCGRISPDVRVYVIVVMFVLFGGGSIWMTVSSIYHIGKDDGRRLEIEHIETLRLQAKPQRDSVNIQNLNEYERTDE